MGVGLLAAGIVMVLFAMLASEVLGGGDAALRRRRPR